MRQPQTGDIILFAGESSFLDRAISWFTGSRYTHVGMVIRDPPGLPRGVHVIESSLEATPNEETGRRTLGVQIQPLAAILSAHGTASIRELRMKNEGERADLTREVAEIERRVDGKPYDLNPGDWLRAEIRILEPKVIWEQQDHSFWCSALVAYVYVRLGLLPQDIPWTLVSPKEWAVDGAMQSRLIDCELGPVLPLHCPPPPIRIPEGPSAPELPPRPRAPRSSAQPPLSGEDS